MDNIKLLYVDLFYGDGGTTTGIDMVKYNGNKCANVIACVDNDANAIANHESNRPDSLDDGDGVTVILKDDYIVVDLHIIMAEYEIDPRNILL